jgi:outer membrane protein assembly factor BamE
MRIKLVLLSTLLASCSYISSPVLSPYKMDIRQGNYITPEMREKLKLGMSKQQVRYVMGTPMVSDAFHGNRWDYIYSLEQRGEVVEKQRLTLYFEGDNLVRMDDGSQPVQAAPAIAQQPVMAPVVAAAPPQPVAKADPSADVLKSVQAWSAAWSAKNVNGYLAAYTPDYKPQGMSRKAWEKQRLERISKPKVIEVGLSEASASMQDDSHATVTFMQRYRSDSHHDEVGKTLRMVKLEGKWLIAEEQAGKAVKAKAQVNEPAGVSAQPLNANQQAVQDAVKRWADAWSARDADKYLASYADGFKPGGMSKAAWEKQRRERIGKAHSIAVEVSDLSIKLRDESHASATFKQAYRSDIHQDNTRKTLQLEKVRDAWLIVSEQAAK